MISTPLSIETTLFLTGDRVGVSYTSVPYTTVHPVTERYHPVSRKVIGIDNKGPPMDQ